MNKITLLLIALVLIASQAFKMRSKDGADDAFALQQDVQNWVLERQGEFMAAFEKIDPTGSAAFEKLMADFVSSAGNAQTLFKDALTQFQNYAQASLAQFGGK